MNNTLVIAILIVLAVIGLGVFGYVYYFSDIYQAPATVSEPESEESSDSGEAGLANPASVYCVEEMNGEILMYENELGIAGYCQLPDGRICEEWRLFNTEGDSCVVPTPEMTPVGR